MRFRADVGPLADARSRFRLASRCSRAGPSNARGDLTRCPVASRCSRRGSEDVPGVPRRCRRGSRSCPRPPRVARGDLPRYPSGSKCLLQDGLLHCRHGSMCLPQDAQGYLLCRRHRSSCLAGRPRAEPGDLLRCPRGSMCSPRAAPGDLRRCRDGSRCSAGGRMGPPVALMKRRGVRMRSEGDPIGRWSGPRPPCRRPRRGVGHPGGVRAAPPGPRSRPSGARAGSVGRSHLVEWASGGQSTTPPGAAGIRPLRLRVARVRATPRHPPVRRRRSAKPVPPRRAASASVSRAPRSTARSARAPTARRG